MMHKNQTFVSVVILLVSFFVGLKIGQAELCNKWGEAKKIGSLDHNLINEASGIEASRRYPGRLYHINDSGGGPYFYVTDIKGELTKKIKIEGKAKKKSDFEDISAGKCGEKWCLVIGDIGDNKSTKPYVELIIIEEQDEFSSTVKPIRRIKVMYPDQPHNAEGMAIHPNGDLFIITKDENLKDFEAYPAKVFMLPAEKWQQGDNSKQELIYIGEIDFRKLNPSGTAYGQVVSSFDIASDGKRFIVLTYEDAIEFNIDLSEQKIKPTSQLERGEDYNLIEIKSLPQQESITYTEDGKSFLYNTEHHWFEAPILKVDCLD